MSIEERILALEEENEKLRDNLDFLSFRIELLAEGTNSTRLLFEYKISHDQYTCIMDLMDEFRKKINQKEEVSHSEFETRISEITGNRDYHLAESLSQAFMEDGRWEEVFPALYGELPKYKYYLEDRKKGGK